MNSEAGPKGGGQDARSKREVPSNCLERLLLCHRGNGQTLIAQSGIEYDQELSH